MRRDLAVMYVTLACLTGFLPACSKDKHVFRSTVFRPTTVSIRDLISKEVIWSNDIPVYHKLVVDFDRESDNLPFRIGSGPAQTMKWELIDQLTKSTVDEGLVDLSGLPIMIEPTYRPGPEVPPNQRQARVPTDRELEVMVVPVATLPAPVDAEPPPIEVVAEEEVLATEEAVPQIDEPAEAVQEIPDSGESVDEEAEATIDE